jgi:hypothetical protein
LSEPATATVSSKILYALCISLSAFLLFQVQPLVAKEILPWFGGSAGVWTTCMLFFQLLLLAGYGYAHWLSRSHRRFVHAGLLLVSVLMFRIIPFDRWRPTDGEYPVLRILALLTATVGVPYFALAATSPLLQSWYGRQHPRGLPYRFFALSNLASMLALLSYPILIEPYLRLHTQAWSWSVAFLFFVAMNYCLFRKSGIPTSDQAALLAPGADPLPGGSQLSLWVLLAACPAALLLAVTNHITQNIAAIPLLWVLPLGAYLLSFILTFAGPRWYPRPLLLGLAAAVLAGMAYAADEGSEVTSIGVLLPGFIGGLFVCCMVCHGELARSKPPAARLTLFYLTVAFGGAMGGVFVAVLAPAVFPALIELPLLLLFTPAVILVTLLCDRPQRLNPVSTLARLSSRRWRVVADELQQTLFWPVWILGVLGVVGLGGYLAKVEWDDLSTARLLTRNFYGALRVADDSTLGVRELAHGTISHGEQYLDPAKRRQPLTYYAPATGVGLLMAHLRQRDTFRLGVIGLGAGTMAAWGRQGDVVRFYEINARVLDIARSEFTFLADCACHPQVVLGDARLSLEREPALQFDALVVDAFSGDSIPVHLLTREAFEVYFRHLKPDGILAVHVSNAYLDLASPVAAVARYLGREAHLIVNDEDDKTRTFASDWVLVGNDEAARFPWFKDKEAKIREPASSRIWTDDFSNLWQILHE